MTGEVAAAIEMPSGIGFLPDGDALVVGMHDKVIWRVRPGRAPAVHAELGHYDGEFLNDMVVDERGVAYVGCRTHRKPGTPRPATSSSACCPTGAPMSRPTT